MCLHHQAVPSIPETPACIARAAFPKGNLYMRMRDELGTFFQDQDFGKFYPTRGQTAQSPWRLALITIMQFVEGLSDRLNLLETHPLFTGRCPQCDREYKGTPQVHWDCVGCEWRDDSLG